MLVYEIFDLKLKYCFLSTAGNRDQEVAKIGHLRTTYKLQ